MNILAARTLGALLGMRINTLFSEKDRPRLQIKTRNGQVRKFAHLTTPNLAGLNHVTRQTSLITVTFTRLSKGEQVVFPVPTGASVVGLVLNMAQTSGALEIEGRTSLRKILNNDYFDIERPMWLVAWNLLEKVVAGPDGIRITCADPTPWTEFEDNDHRIKRGKSESETIVELNGIVIEYPVKNLPMTEAEISELNISNSTEFNLLAPAINV